MPERVQLSRRKGWRMPPNTVKVDRSTRWGNPWTVSAFADPVAEYRDSVLQARNDGGGVVPAIGEIIHHLRGKNLACWCPLNQPCHADVLLEMANTPPTMIQQTTPYRDRLESLHAELETLATDGPENEG